MSPSPARSWPSPTTGGSPAASTGSSCSGRTGGSTSPTSRSGTRDGSSASAERAAPFHPVCGRLRSGRGLLFDGSLLPREIAVRRTLLAALTAALLVVPLGFVALTPATADHTACLASDADGLADVRARLRRRLGRGLAARPTCRGWATPHVFAEVFDVPAGPYEFKVRAERRRGTRTTATPRGPTTRAATSRCRSSPRRGSASATTTRRTPSRSPPPTGAAPLGPVGPRAGGVQPAQGPHEGAVLLRDGRPVRERLDGPTTAVASPAAGSRPGSTPRTRPSTTAVTSRGLIKKLDYIEDLGHDRALDDALVQEQAGAGRGRTRESAGYHGYWITDFTQIDPHLGTNAELKRAHRQGAQEGDEGLLRHHHQPHGRRPRLPPTSTSAARQPVDPLRLQGARSRTATRPGPLRRPRLCQRRTPSRGSTPRRRSRTSRRSAARRTRREGPRLARTTRRCTTTAARHRSPARTASTATSPAVTGRPRRPVDRAAPGGQRDDRRLQDVGPGRRRRRLPDRHREAREHAVLAAVRACHSRAMRPRSATTTSSCSARSSTPTRRSCRSTRPRAACRRPSTSASSPTCPGSPRARRAIRIVGRHPGELLRRGRLVHRRRLERVLAADVPRQPRHGTHREVPHRHRRDRLPRCSSATSSRTP